MSGNVWMFSDEIDDEDLEFMSHDYVTYNMACEYYRLGIKPVVRMAHEAGAVSTPVNISANPPCMNWRRASDSREFCSLSPCAR